MTARRARRGFGRARGRLSARPAPRRRGERPLRRSDRSKIDGEAYGGQDRSKAIFGSQMSRPLSVVGRPFVTEERRTEDGELKTENYDTKCRFRNSIVSATPKPLAPASYPACSFSKWATPAMSMCAQGTPAGTNSLRKMPALIVPAARPPVFFMSAHSDFRF